MKERAKRLRVPILCPEKATELPPLLEEASLDVVAVVAYGLILTRDALELPTHGCINLHASLLPEYRGPAPINWVLINGETQTGLTTMIMDEGIDTGDILLQKSMLIPSEESAADLHDRMAGEGARLLLETLDRFETGDLIPRPQDEENASYAPMLKKSDGRICWNEPPMDLVNHIRGYQPWPGTFTFLEAKRILIEKAAQTNQTEEMPPGTILSLVGDALLVQCGQGTTLLIQQLKPEGRRSMSGRAFLHGGYAATGDRFESEEAS